MKSIKSECYHDDFVINKAGDLVRKECGFYWERPKRTIDGVVHLGLGDAPITTAIDHCPTHHIPLQCPACIASIKSAARAAASRANGKLSKGRPRKPKP